MLKHLRVQTQQKQLLDVAITVSEKLSCIQHSSTNMKMKITTLYQKNSLVLIKANIWDLISRHKKRVSSEQVLYDLYYSHKVTSRGIFSAFFNILSISNTPCNRGHLRVNTALPRDRTRGMMWVPCSAVFIYLCLILQYAWTGQWANYHATTMFLLPNDSHEVFIRVFLLVLLLSPTHSCLCCSRYLSYKWQ